ncbi:MAG: hypothetical protein KatS3mg054_0135 [Chloroflexus sp.]|nr:MAG: hypothetical protein KatS3mg054_0135 [Chloroflexus sp.]
MAMIKPRSRKQKGRRLQVRLAEFLSSALSLPIQATPPTRPGTRQNGSVYVPEGVDYGLLIRPSSMPGIDVVLCSSFARMAASRLFSLKRCLIGFECKNNETSYRQIIKSVISAPAPDRRIAAIESALGQHDPMEVVLSTEAGQNDSVVLACFSANRLPMLVAGRSEWFSSTIRPEPPVSSIIIGRLYTLFVVSF